MSGIIPYRPASASGEIVLGNVGNGPTAQELVDSGLMEPTTKSLQRWPFTHLTRTEQRGLLAQEAAKAASEANSQLTADSVRADRLRRGIGAKCYQAISVEEHIASDPRGLKRLTRVGEIVFIERKKEE